jgi:hypothetical protein
MPLKNRERLLRTHLFSERIPCIEHGYSSKLADLEIEQGTKINVYSLPAESGMSPNDIMSLWRKLFG